MKNEGNEKLMELSIAKEFMLCSLNDKGKLRGMGSETLCFNIACLLELMDKKVISIKEDKFQINQELNEQDAYLLPMYHFIKNSKPMKASQFAMTLSNEPNKELFKTVKEALIVDGCMMEIEKNSLLGKKIYTVAKKEWIDAVVQKVRAEVLEEGVLDQKTIILLALLDKAGLLKSYFSKYESNDLKKRLKEIKQDENHKLLKQMLDYVDAVMVSVIVVSAM